MSNQPIWVGIVEDDAYVRDSLGVLLETQGYSVVSFGRGEEILHATMVANCACLILDVDLPGENGFSLLERLRKQGFLNPVIFLTGHYGEALANQATQTEAILLLKPAPPILLLSKLGELILQGERSGLH